MEWRVEPAAFEAVHSLEQYERLVAWRTLIDGARQQVPCALDVACLVRVQAAVQQFLRFPLPFGDRRSRAVDVCASPIVIALEEDHARPDVDCLFVFGCEVMIKTGDEQLFDARRALGVVRSRRLGRIGALWLRHQSIGCLEYAGAIMGQKPRSVNELADVSPKPRAKTGTIVPWRSSNVSRTSAKDAAPMSLRESWRPSAACPVHACWISPPMRRTTA